MIRSFKPILCSLLIALLAACDGEKPNEVVELAIGARPASVVRGQLSTVVLESEKPFFSDEITLPVNDDTGLAITALDRLDDARAIATVLSDDGTALGLHELLISLGDRVGRVELTVSPDGSAESSIQVEGNAASAGADHAGFSLLGSGTAFDDGCMVSVSGADGMTIESVNVVTSQWIDVSYSISFDQDPVTATITLTDGDESWSVPFVIVAPRLLASADPPSRLVRGRATRLSLTHPDASFNSASELLIGDDGIDPLLSLGWATSTEDGHGVEFPVRAAMEHELGEQPVAVLTRTGGGSFVEIVTGRLVVLDPPWLAFSPAVLEDSTAAQPVTVYASGVDLDVATVGASMPAGLHHANLQVSGGEHSMDVFVGQGMDETVFTLVAEDDDVAVSGLLSVAGQDPFLVLGETSFAAGDTAQVPVVLSGFNLNGPTVELVVDEGLSISAMIVADPSSALITLDVDPLCTLGTHRLQVTVGGLKAIETEIDILSAGL